jgi:hypothetical protein
VCGSTPPDVLTEQWEAANEVTDMFNWLNFETMHKQPLKFKYHCICSLACIYNLCSTNRNVAMHTLLCTT